MSLPLHHVSSDLSNLNFLQFCTDFVFRTLRVRDNDTDDEVALDHPLENEF
jgi:hypothetical protein